MKNLKKLLILLALIALGGQNLFAYEIVKNRDHWGIFGGFSSVKQRTDGFIDNAGIFIITRVTLWCEGWGDDNCRAEAIPVANDGGVFGTAGTDVINAIFLNAETQQEGGTTSGNISETHAFLQADGTYRYFHYTLAWTPDSPNNMVLNINEIYI